MQANRMQEAQHVQVPRQPKQATTLGEALSGADGLTWLPERFLRALGAGPDEPIQSLADCTAKGIAEIIRNLTGGATGEDLNTPAPLLAKSRLFKTSRSLAEGLGGEIAYSFTLTGLHDEPLKHEPPPPQPEYLRRSRSRPRKRSRNRGSKATRNRGRSGTRVKDAEGS